MGMGIGDGGYQCNDFQKKKRNEMKKPVRNGRGGEAQLAMQLAKGKKLERC